VDYFAPLKTWLDEQNRGHAVGWEQALVRSARTPRGAR
jgi:hypothetical protein